MGPPPKGISDKKPIDVRQGTTEVFNYIKAIEKKLTKSQKDAVLKLVDKRKTERIAWVEEQMQDFWFIKHTVTEELADVCVQELPDVPRDFFIHKLHYMLNGVQTLVDKRKTYLKNHPPPRPLAPAAAAPPPPPVAAISTPSPRSDDRSKDGEDGAPLKNTTVNDADVTITEITQHHVEHVTPVPNLKQTPPPALVDASVQTEKVHSPQQYCTPDCLMGGKQGNMEMLKCCLCMRWHHQPCCDAADELQYESTIWTCPTCRAMPTDILCLRQQLSQVTSMLMSLTSKINNIGIQPSHETVHANAEPQQEDTQLITRHDSSSETHDHTPVIVSLNNGELADDTLNDSINTLEQSDDSEALDTSSDTHDQFATEAGPSSENATDCVTPPSNQEQWMLMQKKTKKKANQNPADANTNKTVTNVTLLSDSVLRSLDTRRTQDLCGDANCKLNVADMAVSIGAAVDTLLGDSIPREDPVVVHTGTNHVERENVYTITRRLERLEYTLQKYSRVALSSIVHRRSDSKNVREKIVTLNTTLLEMCTKNNWVFIDNDNVDESCLLHSDRVHTNKYGDERLAHNVAQGLKELVLSNRRTVSTSA